MNLMRWSQAAVLVFGLGSGCAGVAEEPTDPGIPNRVRIEPWGGGGTFGVLVGVSVPLTAQVLDRNGQPVVPQPEVVFSSTQPNQVAVTPGGGVTGVDVGHAWVFARVTGAAAARPDSVAIYVTRFASPTGRRERTGGAQ